MRHAMKQAQKTLDLEDFRIPRDNDRDLTFTGWKIGEGEHGTGGSSGYSRDWNRGTKVTLFLTLGGKIVAHTHYWSCWQGESDHDGAVVVDSVDALHEYLRDEDSGVFGSAAKEALIDAESVLGSEAGTETIA